jgi:carboxypeptidase family protein
VPQLTGTITVHGSKPAKLATVEVINEGGDVVDQIVVSDDGKYQYHLAAGNWTLNIYDPHGHRGRQDVQLGDDDATVNVDLSEPEGGH